MSQESAAAQNSPIQDYLRELHARHTSLRDGQVATYIPELAKADPDWFGICLVTTEGHVYEVGDSRQHFTIQSISKPFVYGLALEDNTRAEVFKKISVEPTGEAFNAISLEPGTGRPRNPMINAGAIAAAGMIQPRGSMEAFTACCSGSFSDGLAGSPSLCFTFSSILACQFAG
jgi:glutaminase